MLQAEPGARSSIERTARRTRPSISGKLQDSAPPLSRHFQDAIAPFLPNKPGPPSFKFRFLFPPNTPGAMTQKALIVRTGPAGHDGLEELNIELERGWAVADVSPMGGAATDADTPTHAALVILERRGPDRPTPTAAVAALEEIGEESEDVVEQVVEETEGIVEGNGADPFEDQSS
jgi:hypothetical protein